MTRITLLGVVALLIASTRGTADEPRYNGQPIRFWLDGLQNDDVRIRAGAAYALAEMGPPAKAALPALEAALGDPEGRVRVAAVHAFTKMGDLGVPGLRRVLRGADASLQAKAIDTLGNLGPAAKDAVPDLVALLDHEAASFDPDRFVMASQALARIGPDASPAIPRLRRVLLLDDKELLPRHRERLGFAAQMRKEAATALTQIHDPSGSGRVIALIIDSAQVNWRERPAAEKRQVEAFLALLRYTEATLSETQQDEPAATAVLKSLAVALPRAPRNRELTKALGPVEKAIEAARGKQPAKAAQPESKPDEAEKKADQAEPKAGQADVKPAPIRNAFADAADEALAAIDAYHSVYLDAIWELCGPVDSQAQALQKIAAVNGVRTKAAGKAILLKSLGEVRDVPTLERVVSALGAPKGKVAPAPK